MLASCQLGWVRTVRSWGVLFGLALIAPGAALSESIYLIRHGAAPQPGCFDQDPGGQSATIAVVELTEKGSFKDLSQLGSAVDCIERQRVSGSAAVVVVLFIHGWHHNADWDASNDGGDSHFASFRRSLLSLSIRESELAFRRIFGIYVGWPGTANQSLLASEFSFWNKYDTASSIGTESAILETIRRVIEATKAEIPSQSYLPESFLLMIGHSMGALMLETAFLTLLEDDQWIAAPSRASRSYACQEVQIGGRPVLFADTVLLINTAAEAEVARALVDEATRRDLRKTVACSGLREAPVFISASSVADTATRFHFVLGKLLSGKLTRTSGNTGSLYTHEMTLDSQGFLCPKRNDVPDFGQSWHCLRRPQVVGETLTSVDIDLPQIGASRSACHQRYRLAARPSRPGYHPYWVFQTPSSLMTEHSDIFNARAGSFVMALSQLSGTTLSLAQSYDENFSPEVGPCQLPAGISHQSP